MSPIHRDPEGRTQAAGSWGGVVERLITEAQERGAFDDLPHHGKPLPVEDTSRAGDMALAYTVLRNAGAALPWIESDKEVRTLREQRDRLLDAARRASPATHGHYRHRLRELVARHDRAVAAVNASAPSAAQHRRPMRLDDELAALEEAFGRRD